MTSEQARRVKVGDVILVGVRKDRPAVVNAVDARATVLRHNRRAGFHELAAGRSSVRGPRRRRRIRTPTSNVAGALARGVLCPALHCDNPHLLSHSAPGTPSRRARFQAMAVAADGSAGVLGLFWAAFRRCRNG